MPNNYYTPTTAFGMGQEDEEETLDYSQADVAVPAAYGDQHPNMVADDNAPRIAALDENGLQAPAPREDGSVPTDTRTEAQKMAGEQEQLREQYLARYQQAKADASSSTVQGKDGYQYAPVMSDTDKWTDTLLKGAAALFMVGMPAAGIAAAAMTWMGNSDKQHRQGQIRHLEEKGYKGRDIQAWIDSGDHRFLAEDKVENKYITPGAGRVFDTSTGQWVEAPGAVPGGSPTDSKPYQDENGEWWQPQWNTDGSAKPPKHLPNYGKNKGGNGGDGNGNGYSGDTTDIFQDENGQYWQRQYDTKGNAKPPKHLPNYGKTLDAKTPELTRVDSDTGVTWTNADGRIVDLDDMPDAAMTTDGQRKNASFVRRATNAEKTFRDVTDPSKYDPTEWEAYVSGKGYWPEVAKSDDRRKMEAARREFGNAVLRTDTGAAYSLLEQSDVDKLFPQAGDSKELVEQKRVQREEILSALAQGTGGGQRYAQSHIQKKLYGGDKKKGNTSPTPAAAPSPAQTRGAEFDKTKPGAKQGNDRSQYADIKTFGGKEYGLKKGAPRNDRNSWVAL